MSGSGATQTSSTYKVGRVIERYDLDGWREELVDRWLGNNGDAESLRDLADSLNIAILRSAFEEQNRQPVGGEVEAAYQTLSGDGANPANRTRLRRELEREGINVDQIEKDFVTHQAVHTYLRKGRGVTKETAIKDRAERAGQTIQRLKGKTVAVTESELERVAASTDISLGDPDVLVSVTVTCRDCGVHGTATEMLQNGGCDCD